MSEPRKLIDPNLPWYEIIRGDDGEPELTEDGKIQRNDGVPLIPARRNHWYQRATIAGEMSEGIRKSINNDKIQKQNIPYWNGYCYDHLTEKDHAEIKPFLNDIQKETFKSLTREENSIIAQKIENCPDKIFPPYIKINNNFIPTIGNSIISSTENYFESPLNVNYFIFPTSFFCQDTTFHGDADFSNTFFTNVIFDKTVFNSVSFNKSTFRYTNDFKHTIFNGNANFNDTIFQDKTNFNIAIFQKEVNFNASIFDGEIIFSNATFKAKTDFTNATFKKHVPKFFEATLHQDTIFTTDPKNWPDESKNDKETTEKNLRAYGRLRQIMNSQQRVDDELFFYRQEMHCKQKIDPWYNKIFSIIFRILSDYGFSIWRPVFWFITTGLAAFIFYMLCYAPPDPAFYSKILGDNSCQWSYADKLALSFSNMLPYLGLTAKNYPDFHKCIGVGFELLTTVQFLVGGLLLFLFALGLRNRFRLK